MTNPEAIEILKKKRNDDAFKGWNWSHLTEPPKNFEALDHAIMMLERVDLLLFERDNGQFIDIDEACHYLRTGEGLE